MKTVFKNCYLSNVCDIRKNNGCIGCHIRNIYGELRLLNKLMIENKLVPAIPCENCIHSTRDGCAGETMYCKKLSAFTDEKFYCKYGEDMKNG